MVAAAITFWFYWPKETLLIELLDTIESLEGNSRATFDVNGSE